MDGKSLKIRNDQCLWLLKFDLLYLFLSFRLKNVATFDNGKLPKYFWFLKFYPMVPVSQNFIKLGHQIRNYTSFFKMLNIIMYGHFFFFLTDQTHTSVK